VARRLAIGAASVILGVGAVALTISYFNGKDSSQVGDAPGPGLALPDEGNSHLTPGQPSPTYKQAPPASGAHHVVALRRDATTLSNDQLLTALEQGNVVLLYGTPKPPPALKALARDEAAEFTPDVAAGGGAIVLGRRPGTNGIIALAWRRMLHVPNGQIGALRNFADAYLGGVTAP
jgi:hypothetical protein